MNLERIEVLKGPAAILFGRIEPGGLINRVTKQPLSTPYDALEQQFGSFDFYRTTLDATGPITRDDTLADRVNLAYENSSSFREFIETERVFLNPVLRWKLSEQTQANFWVQYTNTDEPFDLGIPQLGNRPAPIPRERNLGEGDGGAVDIDNTRIGFDWSHAFNDRWTLRHTFETVLQHENFHPRFLLASPPDPARCSAQDCPLDRFLVDGPSDTDSYYTALNLTGKLDTSWPTPSCSAATIGAMRVPRSAALFSRHPPSTSSTRCIPVYPVARWIRRILSHKTSRAKTGMGSMSRTR